MNIINNFKPEIAEMKIMLQLQRNGKQYEDIKKIKILLIVIALLVQHCDYEGIRRLPIERKIKNKELYSHYLSIAAELDSVTDVSK